jgi:hypothetical protein
MSERMSESMVSGESMVGHTSTAPLLHYCIICAPLKKARQSLLHAVCTIEEGSSISPGGFDGAVVVWSATNTYALRCAFQFTDPLARTVLLALAPPPPPAAGSNGFPVAWSTTCILACAGFRYPVCSLGEGAAARSEKARGGERRREEARGGERRREGASGGERR